MTSKAPTATKRRHRPKKIVPVHPGEILREDVLKPSGMSVIKLALSVGVPVTTMRRIVSGRRPITPNIALRLARFLRTTPEYWIRLQAQHDMDMARDKFSADIQAHRATHRLAA